MSLVNDMLKDLDRRDKKSGAESVRVLHPQYNESARQQAPILIIIIAIIGIGVGLLGGYFYFGQSRGESPPILTSMQPVENQEPVVELIDEPLLGANSELIDVQTRGIEGGFELSLNFSKETDFQQRQSGPGVLNIKFADTRLVNTVTRSVPGNLAGLSINNITDGVEVNLDTGVSTLFNIDKRTEGASYIFSVVALLNETGQGEEGQSVVSNSSGIELDQDSNTGLGRNNLNELQDDSLSSVNTEVEDTSVSVNRPARVNRELSFSDQDNNVSQRSIGLAQRGQLIEAYRSLLEFIEDNPQAHKSRETLATLLISQNESQQALDLLQRGLDIAPAHSPFVRLQARSMIMDGDNKQSALSLLENNPPVVAVDPDYHDLMASLYQQLGNHQGAIETYQNLLRVRPDEGRWWTAMGISHEAIGNINEAVGSYQTALQMPMLESNLRQYTQSRVQVLSQ